MTSPVPGQRTLFITQDFPPDRGGIARLYAELCTRMPGVEVSTVAQANAWPVDGCPVHRMPFAFRRAHRPYNILRWTRWAKRFVRQHGVTLVHAGNIRPSGYVAALIRRQLGIPYIVYVHGKDLLKERRKGKNRWLVRAGTREILGNAAAIVANSRATATLAKDLLRSVGRIDAVSRVHVIHPGADPSRFSLTARDAADRNDPVLLSVARLVPRKGIDTVIEALPDILAVHPTATYVVVGSGPDLSRLERLARDCGVTHRVRFVGDVIDEQLPERFANADVFVLPTREIHDDDEIEGFGIVYVEAAAAGVPSVAADVGGVADAVTDGVTGLLVPPGSPAAVSTATLRLLGDPILCAEMGNNARAAVERELNWDRAAREVMRVVNDLTRHHDAVPNVGTAQPVLRKGWTTD
jgi:phosphatidylinositol alpha-1,6-mannosyltransferase